MRKANWFIVLLLAFAVAVPASAVEFSLGGFPSYMSTRARYIQGATYKSASATKQNDRIFFVDTTLRLTPQLQLTDSVTVRAQVDVFDNNVWGGRTDQLLGGGSTLVNSSISPSDKFRGSLLHGNTSTNCLNFGNFCAVEDDAGFFNVRMFHADVVLPNELGFIRVGRQPFDWGIGILANGGWNPHSDGGFLVDRFLWLKTFTSGEESTFTLIFVSDRITQGTGLKTDGGDGWDGGAVAGVFNHPNAGGLNVTLGGYLFPYIHQDKFIGGFGDLDRYTLYSGLIDIKSQSWRFVGELQGGFGEIQGILGAADAKIKNALLWAIRAEYTDVATEFVNIVGAEFGWADGDENEGEGWISGNEAIQGGVIVFNPAYNLDNLLFKHVMPSIYQDAHPNTLARTDASVQNAYYGRFYADVPILDWLSFKPQFLIGWNEQTSGLIGPPGSIGSVPNGVGTVDGATLGADNSAKDGRKTVTTSAEQPAAYSSSYLGTQLEGTFSFQVHPGVNFDIIGSIIFAGTGLTDLLEAQAFKRDNTGTTEFADQAAAEAAVRNAAGTQQAEDILWGVQTRLIIYIDEFFKS